MLRSQEIFMLALMSVGGILIDHNKKELAQGNTAPCRHHNNFKRANNYSDIEKPFE
jgi:hypothetical protein